MSLGSDQPCFHRGRCECGHTRRLAEKDTPNRGRPFAVPDERGALRMFGRPNSKSHPSSKNHGSTWKQKRMEMAFGKTIVTIGYCFQWFPPASKEFIVHV